MKWVNGLTFWAKDIRNREWHKWFAWYPVIIDYVGEGRDKRNVKVWLQYILRREDSYGEWEYKEEI